MDREEEQNEYAWIDAMGCREAALDAMVGNLTVVNVPTDRVRRILRNTEWPLLQLACQIVLHSRGEEWQNSE